MQYVFILGHNPKLSAAEIMAVLPAAKKVLETNAFLILENEEIDCLATMRRLGGTIKIGRIIGDRVKKEILVQDLLENKPENKLNFGISFYESKPWKLGMEVKAELKNAGVSCRLVVSKEKTLSSVVVAKNKVQEFMIFANKYLAKTCAVQEFEEYGFRDYGRPGRDLVSGMMPPKLAKIMINLSQVPVGAVLLDPFCGSGTIIQEALLLGFENIIGCDISEKAISDTEENLAWLAKNSELEIKAKAQVFQADVRDLAVKIKSVDAIIAEPFLGPPLRGHEKLFEVKKTVEQLSELYVQAFGEFRKILSSGGRIVIIFPSFRIDNQVLELPILSKIQQLGFTQVNRDKLIYSRDTQKVWRQIYIFE
ncbi:MAG: DNA methyltransferase [Candidatus Buchananbacteria bacterium]